MAQYVKKQKEKMERKRLREEKEWNDPYNKYIRELTKKHYRKNVKGDKKKKALQKEIVTSIKD